MNNQRRHQLEQNVLAGYLGACLAHLRPLIKPALIGLAVGLVAFVGYSIYQGELSKQNAQAWTRFYFNLSGDVNSFEDLASQYSRTSAAEWARQAAALGYLQNGIEALYVNRQEGVNQINKAIADLEQLKNSSIRELKNQALLGLARGYESLGDLEQATQYYQLILNSTGFSDVEREQIGRRLGFLQTEEAKSFYGWFAQLDPKPVAPPELSGDLSLPPSEPPLTFDPANLPELPAANGEPAESAAATDVELSLPTGAQATGDQPASDGPASNGSADEEGLEPIQDAQSQPE